MLRSSESETEILLGNKQLLGIFFAVAVLIGIAFGGGYMLGRGPSDKKTVTTPAPVKEAAAVNATNPTGGETRTVSPSDSAPPDANPAGQVSEEPALGSRKRAKPAQADAPSAAAASPAPDSGDFVPQNGQEFLQVGALPHGEALSVTEVLQRKGFPTHAVPVPNNPKLYRVLVGPVRDVADLSSKREALRTAGFGKVIVQKY